MKCTVRHALVRLFAFGPYWLTLVGNGNWSRRCRTAKQDGKWRSQPEGAHRRLHLGRSTADQGVDTAFCVPGESYLAVLDALYEERERIRLIVCRQEGGAANMAEAYGKLTNRPGVCFVTRGPGATNASTGVHTAFQDSTPMVLFIGQVARGMRHREGFQEVDFAAMFAPLAKWSAEISDAARIPEYVHRAFQVAMAGRPGPVVLSLPEDVLSDLVGEVPEPGSGRRPFPPRRARTSSTGWKR